MHYVPGIVIVAFFVGGIGLMQPISIGRSLVDAFKTFCAGLNRKK